MWSYLASILRLPIIRRFPDARGTWPLISPALHRRGLSISSSMPQDSKYSARANGPLRSTAIAHLARDGGNYTWPWMKGDALWPQNSQTTTWPMPPCCQSYRVGLTGRLSASLPMVHMIGEKFTTWPADEVPMSSSPLNGAPQCHGIQSSKRETGTSSAWLGLAERSGGERKVNTARLESKTVSIVTNESSDQPFGLAAQSLSELR